MQPCVRKYAQIQSGRCCWFIHPESICTIRPGAGTEDIERADQIGHIGYKARMTCKDGSVFPVQMDLVSVAGEDGELVYRVATAQDISERKQAEEKIMQQARLLEQVNDAVLAADENFVLTSWNSAAERIFGWKAGGNWQKR